MHPVFLNACTARIWPWTLGHFRGFLESPLPLKLMPSRVTVHYGHKNINLARVKVTSPGEYDQMERNDVALWYSGRSNIALNRDRDMPKAAKHQTVLPRGYPTQTISALRAPPRPSIAILQGPLSLQTSPSLAVRRWKAAVITDFDLFQRGHDVPPLWFLMASSSSGFLGHAILGVASVKRAST